MEADMSRADGGSDPRVDEAIALLDGLDEQPVAGHVAVFDEVHRRLHEALTGLDAG